MLKQKITNDFVVYSLATYVTQAIGIVTSLSMRYFLDPASMGRWALLEFLLGYGLYANVGVLQSLTTELPINVGRNDTEKVRDLRDVSLTFVIGMCSIVGIFFILAAFFLKTDSAELRIGLAVTAFLLIGTAYYNFHISLMQAEKRFVLLSQAIMLNAALFLILILTLVSRFKLIGLLASVLLSNLITIFFVQIRSKTRFHLTLKKNVLAELVKAGLPLMAVGFAYSTFMGIDRLMITRYLGLTSLGYYSIALLAMTYADVIPNILSIVIFPNMQESFGQSGSYKSAGQFVLKPTLLSAYGTPVFLGLAYFTVPYLVQTFLPKYLPGLSSMRICLVGVFFLALAHGIYTYLMTIYKRMHHIPILVCGMIVSAGASAFFIHRGMGLEGVAIGMSVGFFSYYSILFFYVFRHFCTLRETVFYYAETIFCFVYFAAGLYGVSRISQMNSAFLDWGMRACLFIMFCLPLFWRIEVKTSALTLLAKTLVDWTKTREKKIA